MKTKTYYPVPKGYATILVCFILANINFGCAENDVFSDIESININSPQSAVPGSGTTYYIKSVKSGYYIDVSGYSHANGGKIHQWSFTGNKNQQWQLISTGDSNYQLKSVESGKSFDIAGRSTANGAYLQQWSYGGGSNQQFTITSVGSGYYSVRALHSGKALDGTGKTARGTRIWQWTTNSSNVNQKWLFEEVGGSTDGTSYSSPGEIPKFHNAIGDAKLQTPGSNTAATASQLLAGYSSSYFQVVNDDEIAFYQTGADKRTELRFENNFYVTSGSRTVHANLKIVSQAGDQSTFIQIHDDANVGSGPNKPLLRMYRLNSDGHLWAAVKTNSGGSATTHIDCGSAPSGYFDCDVSLNNGNMTVKINGSTKVSRSVSFWNFPSYWKAGVYNQNSGGTTINFAELTW